MEPEVVRRFVAVSEDIPIELDLVVGFLEKRFVGCC